MPRTPTRTRARARTPARRTRTQKSPFKKAEVGRFDGTYHSVVFKENDTIGSLLSKANITLNSGDEINDDKGNAVSSNDNAKETTYHIVGNYKNGQ